MITFFGIICELLTQSLSENATDVTPAHKHPLLNVNKKKESYASYIMGCAAVLSGRQYRRQIETLYVYLKTDLDLSGLLNHTQTKLISHLRDETIFSKEFTAFFSSDPMGYMDVEPENVIKIKAVLRALNNLELGLNGLLDINANSDRNVVALHYDIVPKLCSLANTLVTEFNALNQGSSDIEVLIGSYVNPLISKLCAVMTPIDFKSITLPSVGQVIKLLPESSHNSNQGLGNLSELIYQLPLYFQELQTLIDPDSLKKLSVYDSGQLKTKTHRLLKNLKKLASSEGLALLPSGLSTVKLLLDHLPTLLNVSGEFTKESHKKLEYILNQLRHENFPSIIAELEGMEEHFSLRPNLLVEPTLNSMNKFYTSLSSISDHWIKTADVIDQTVNQLRTPRGKLVRSFFGNLQPLSQGKKLSPVSTLNVLCDDIFIETVRNMRVMRWIETDYAQRDSSVIEAAERFFQNASDFFEKNETWSNALSALDQDYKIIQPYYAKLYPELDLLFVNHFPLWLERFDRNQSPVSLIKQTAYQAEFKRHSIEIHSATHDKLYRPDESVLDFKQQLQTKQSKEKNNRYTKKMTGIKNNRLYKPLQAFREQAKFKPPLYRALSESPSKKLNDFIEGGLKAWLEKNLDSELFTKLSFDPEHMIKAVVVDNELQTYTDTKLVFSYKKLLCSLSMIQKTLVKLEELYEKKVSSTQFITILMTDKQLATNVSYATQFISEAVVSTELSELLTKGLECLEPLKNIPVLRDYINLIHIKPMEITVSDNDVVTRWKQQTELFRQALATKSNFKITPEPQTQKPAADLGATALDEDILLQLSKQLYRTPQLIRQCNPDNNSADQLTEDELNEKAATLISAIKMTRCNLATLRIILSSVNELNDALSNVGVEAKSIIISLENKLRMTILASADETEFKLGYKPGSISISLNNGLNDYFRQLMIDFPVIEEEKLELISSAECIEHRLENEKTRLIKTQEECHIHLTKMNYDIVSGYQELAIIQTLIMDPIDGFSQENIERYLQLYQKLQPYLYQINACYDPICFLRQLQNKDDFIQLFENIQTQKNNIFLLVEQEKQGFHDAERRCHDRIKFMENNKKLQEQSAVNVKHIFKVDMLLHNAFHNGNNALNMKFKSRLSEHYDPVISAFRLVINVLALKKNTLSEESEDNLISTFELTKTKWNADLSMKARERAKKTTTYDGVETAIQDEVSQLYSNYSDLIDLYQQLDIMSAYIKRQPSKSPNVDEEKIRWINIMKKSLSNHDIPPRQRLINIAIIGSGLDCKNALEQQADRFFTRMVRKLYKFFFGIDSPEKTSRLHLHKKFEAFKEQQYEKKFVHDKSSPPASGQ